LTVSERVELSPSVVDWILSLTGVTVREGVALPGATTAEVVAFEIENTGYVLKLFSKAAFVEEDPDRAVHEASVLEVMETVEVPWGGCRAGAPSVSEPFGFASTSPQHRKTWPRLCSVI
jgi:hypothetical protein